MGRPFILFGMGLLITALPGMTAPPSGTAGAAARAMSRPSTSSGEAYGKLPMSFEKNAGQSSGEVDFIARGAGYSVFLTPGEAVLALKKHPVADRPHDPAASETAGGATIRMALVGASRGRAAGERELPGKANYIIGNESAKWKTGIPTFEKVRYAGVYPGIDIVYYGNQGRLEYDFIVAPGADPGAIRLGFTGARAQIEQGGDLTLAMSAGSVSMHRPHVYQEIDGTKRPVSGEYVKRDDGRIGFALGAYDTARPLVIDPVLHYATYLGGSSMDVGTAIAVDLAGNAYVTGWTESSDFPVQAAEQATIGGRVDAFVAKIDPSGSAVLYSTYFGGGDDDSDGFTGIAEAGAGIAVDPLGQASVAGHTRSSDFPITAGAYQTTYGTGGDAFVAKFNASGSTLVYSTYLGGSGYDVATGIAIDPSGNAYVAGFNYQGQFPTTPGASQEATGGSYDAFISKLNPTGSALAYSTYLGGLGDDTAAGIAIDPMGNALVTGSTNSPNFPLQSAQQGVFGGYYDAFATKLNATGSALVYSTYLGGSGIEHGRGIAVDASGNAYVAGQTGSSDFPTTPGAYQTTYGGAEDAFVVKIAPSGSVVYSTYVGGSGVDAANAIAVDPSGNAYVTGNNYLGGFPTLDPLQGPYPPSFDAFVAKFASNGALVYSTYLGGASNDLGLGIVVDLMGNAYVVGNTQSIDFPVTPGASQQENGGLYDGFVAKIAAPSAGKITGGGSIAVPGGIGTFGFTVQRQTAGGSIRGALHYVDHTTRFKIQSVTVTAFSVGDTEASFGGTCIDDTGAACTFTVEVSDTGEPGAADTFFIAISGRSTEGGVLRSGNIQVHR
jgi:hypothetical protein